MNLGILGLNIKIIKRILDIYLYKILKKKKIILKIKNNI